MSIDTYPRNLVRDDQRDPLRMIRYPDLVRLGIVSNRQTLRRWVADEAFPAPIKLGRNMLAWRAVEVLDWIEKRADEREELIRRWGGGK